jgi:pimeloyl-ACP methyl ester carboxylesterase
MMLKSVSFVDHNRISTFVYPFNPAVSAQKVDVPCFFIHCKHDEKVPVSAARQFFASVKGAKMLWITNGRHHYDSIFYNTEEYAQRVGAFIDQVLLGQWANKTKQMVLEDRDDELMV